MRDIRADLEERVDSLKEQLNTAQALFESHISQLEQEHDSRLKTLKADLDAVNLLLGAEQRRLDEAPSTPEPSEPKPQQPHPARPQTGLDNMVGLRRAG